MKKARGKLVQLITVLLGTVIGNASSAQTETMPTDRVAPAPNEPAASVSSAGRSRADEQVPLAAAPSQIGQLNAAPQMRSHGHHHHHHSAVVQAAAHGPIAQPLPASAGAPTMMPMAGGGPSPMAAGPMMAGPGPMMPHPGAMMASGPMGQGAMVPGGPMSGPMMPGGPMSGPMMPGGPMPGGPMSGPMMPGRGPMMSGPMGPPPAALGLPTPGPEFSAISQPPYMASRMGPTQPMPPGQSPHGALHPASFGPTASMPMMGGPPMPQPPGGPGELAGYSGGGGGGACTSCAGGGCADCAGTGGTGMLAGILGNVVSSVLPYAEGGRCAPRWYDVSIDAMYLTREEVARTVNFTSDGIAGAILLSTDDLDFDEQIGFRFTAARQIFAGSTVEFTYFGLFNWATSATVDDDTLLFPDDLFSVMSQFGTLPFNGFDETDRADRHSIGYSSTIDNFELHVRKRWQGPNCRVQGSWLMGVRYLYLLEDFQYLTVGGDNGDPTPGEQSRGTMDYNIRARNSLTGFQLGGDLWTNVIPGINVGGGLKIGAYGNYANQATRIVASLSPFPGPAPPPTTFGENVDANDIAFISEANFSILYRLGPHFTLRGGYNFLFIDGVVLAPESFNATPPNILTTGGGFAFPPRVASINDNGNLFYHGATAALEWTW